MTAPAGPPDRPARPLGLLDGFGARTQRRAEPRMGIAVAGAGCALAVIGTLFISGDRAGSVDDFNRVPGIVLCALVIGAGFAVLAAISTGPLATAGVVASALGVPPLLFFVTADLDRLPPYNTEAILLVSTLAWLASWAVGPGRGRPFYLGAGLLGIWASLLQLTEDLFDAPYGLIGFFVGGFDTGATFEAGDPTLEGPFEQAMPDPTTLGLVSLVLGLAYVVVGRWLDRSGRFGAGTPFVAAALPALTAAVLFLGEDLETEGAGLLTIALGAILVFHGATAGRRFTTWFGGGAVTLGAAIFLADMSDDTTVIGMLFLAAGIGVVAAGHAIGTALDEPDEMTPGVSVLAGRRAGPPAGPDDGLGGGGMPPPPPPPAPHDPSSGWAPPSGGPPPTFEPPAPPPGSPGHPPIGPRSEPPPA